MGAERVGIGVESSVAGAGEDGSIVFTGMDERGKGKESRERDGGGEKRAAEAGKRRRRRRDSVFLLRTLNCI